MVWSTSCSAETNRTPFDFAEGWSELVQGFNVEYRGGGFAFLAEFTRMLIMYETRQWNITKLKFILLNVF